MANARALANQKLYHARVLAAAWRAELAGHNIPATVLTGAFDEPCRTHLREAYGWFLLEILQAEPLPATPPENCGALPQVAVGKVLPGEIRELAQLEQNGWVADILASGGTGLSARVRSPGNLATAADTPVGPDQVDAWIDLLQDTFNRMSDSLDEY